MCQLLEIMPNSDRQQPAQQNRPVRQYDRQVFLDQVLARPSTALNIRHTAAKRSYWQRR